MRAALIVLALHAVLAVAFGSLSRRDITRDRLSHDNVRRSMIHDPEPNDCVDSNITINGETAVVYCSWHDGTYIIETYASGTEIKAFGISYKEALDRFMATVAKTNPKEDDHVGLGV